MAQYLYVRADPAAQQRAATLGCGWVGQVPPQFTATAPCVIISGAGQTVVLADDGSLTNAQVQSAAQPIVTAEQQLAATAATQATNQASLQQKAQQALTNNTTFIGQAKPSTAATQASQAYDQTVALSRQVDGVIRLLLGLLDSTAGT